jgi:hypothetical protein
MEKREFLKKNLREFLKKAKTPKKWGKKQIKIIK